MNQINPSSMGLVPERPSREKAARIGLLILLTGVMIVVIVGWQFRKQVTVLQARLPENGGWLPANLQGVTGQPLEIVLTSTDVLHSFAIGQSDTPPVDIHPGENTKITLTFDKPGKYVFYCTRWCGANHWRMRGVIEVSDRDGGKESPSDTQPVQPPYYIQIGLNLDAEHHTEILPSNRPSAANTAQAAPQLPVNYLSEDFYRATSPADAWKSLRAEQKALGEFNDQQIWDLVAYIWASNTSTQALQEGQIIYRQNCAACHGETGAGDGVFALKDPETSTHSDQEPHTEPGSESVQMGHSLQAPTDFTDSEHMLAASPALLHGKIVRGGMGTGMPYWGPIFTEEQTWALVSYLWSFQFDL